MSTLKLNLYDRGIINTSAPALVGCKVTKIGNYHDSTLGPMSIFFIDNPPPGKNVGVVLPDYCCDRVSDTDEDFNSSLKSTTTKLKT